MSTSGGIETGGVSVATAHLTAAQIDTLFSVSVELVPAGDADTLVVVVDVIYETVAGNSAWDAAGAGIYYAGNVSDGEQIDISLEDMAQFTNSLPATQVMTGVFAVHPAWDTATVAGAAVVVSMPTADPLRSAPIATSSLAAAGLGYAPGDTGTIDDPVFGAHAAYIIDTVGALGVVLTYHLTSPGGAYDPTGSPYDTTAAGAQPGAGTGLTVNILTLAPATGDLYVTAFYQTIDTH